MAKYIDMNVFEELIKAAIKASPHLYIDSIYPEQRKLAREAMDRGCRVPPEGWWCSREKGHGGPCAARSIES